MSRYPRGPDFGSCGTKSQSSCVRAKSLRNRARFGESGQASLNVASDPSTAGVRSDGLRGTSSDRKRYTSRVLLILVAFGVAVFGVVRLARPLEPRQRVALVLVCIAGLVLLILKLVQLGMLGRVTPEP